MRVVVMRREQRLLTQTGERMCHKTFIIRRKRAAKNVSGGGKSLGSQKLHEPELGGVMRKGMGVHRMYLEKGRVPYQEVWMSCSTL